MYFPLWTILCAAPVAPAIEAQVRSSLTSRGIELEKEGCDFELDAEPDGGLLVTLRCQSRVIGHRPAGDVTQVAAALEELMVLAPAATPARARLAPMTTTTADDAPKLSLPAAAPIFVPSVDPARRVGPEQSAVVAGLLAWFIGFGLGHAYGEVYLPAGAVFTVIDGGAAAVIVVNAVILDYELKHNSRAVTFEPIVVAGFLMALARIPQTIAAVVQTSSANDERSLAFAPTLLDAGEGKPGYGVGFGMRF